MCFVNSLVVNVLTHQPHLHEFSWLSQSKKYNLFFTDYLAGMLPILQTGGYFHKFQQVCMNCVCMTYRLYSNRHGTIYTHKFNKPIEITFFCHAFLITPQMCFVNSFGVCMDLLGYLNPKSTTYSLITQGVQLSQCLIEIAIEPKLIM